MEMVTREYTYAFFFQNKYKIATIKERKLGVLYKIFLTVIKSNCNGDVTTTFKKVTMKLM